MILKVVIYFLLQAVGTVGVIVLFGFLVGLLNRVFYSNFGRYQRAVCLVTGFIGTPVHELSHAAMCVIFGHKITAIKLFQISDDGTLGYVSHSYNPKNIWHRIGNFFIGIAPILGITGVLYLLCYLIAPVTFYELSFAAEKMDTSDIQTLLSSFMDLPEAFFSGVTTLGWWIFVVAGSFLSLHATLSKADIKGAADGLIFLLALLLIADAALAIISPAAFYRFVDYTISFSGVLTSFLSLSLFISLVATGVSFAARKFIK